MYGIKGTEAAVAVIAAVSLVGSPPTAHAFEPLSAFAVKVGTSLLVKGFNFLVGKAVESPDLQFEKTKQIHAELRAVHRDVLKNRALQVDIHEKATLHRDEMEELIINTGEGIKQGVERSAELQRILNVLSSTQHVLNTAEILRRAQGEEHSMTLQTLREEVSHLDREGLVLDFGEHLRPAMVLPRIGAIQAKWEALQAMEDTEQTRAHFVRGAGRWLESQRHRMGERDPVKQTLADVIAGMERHAQGVDRYLAELGNPCSALWDGYLTIEGFRRDGRKAVWVNKVGVSQARREVTIARPKTDAEEEAHHADSPLVQPTRLTWSKRVRTLGKPVRLATGDTGEDLHRALRRIHRDAFDCDRSTSASYARKRLASQVPDVPGKRAGTGAGLMPEIGYEDPNLTVRELVTRRSCGEEERCRHHWETVQMRRNAASALLTGLYAVREEVNRTLAWLAKETVGAQCTYLRDEPRVCLFEDEGTEGESSEAGGNLPGTRPGEGSASGGTEAVGFAAYRMAREWSQRLNEEQVAGLRYERAQAAMTRNVAIGRMRSALLEQSREISRGHELNDQRLREVAAEIARMVWVRMAVSAVQDQVTELIENAADQMVARVREGEDSGGGPSGWTMIVLEPQEEGTGATGNGGGAGQIGRASGQGRSGGDGVLRTRETVLMAMFPERSEGQTGESGLTNNYAESVYGQMSGLNSAQQLALWLPEVPPRLTNTLAGVGDGVTLGVTRRVRDWVGLSVEVDTRSGAYRNGTLIGLLGPGAAGARAGLGALKIGKQLIRTGKFQKKLGDYSVLMRAGHGQRTQGISLIYHGSKGRSGRLLGLDLVTRFRGGGSIASKLPHINIGTLRAHLPWEPAWLVPAAITAYHAEAE